MNINSALIKHSTVFYCVVVFFAVIAFYPNYIADPLSKDYRFHFHALTMTVWCVLLITQPFLIRTGKGAVHKKLGRITYVVAPLVVISILILNHHQALVDGLNPFRVWLITSTLGEVFLFLVAYVMAIRARRNPLIHARYMLCTGIVFFPAIFDRVFMRSLPESILGILPNLGGVPLTVFLSYFMVLTLLIGLAVWDRSGKKPTSVFILMSGAFVVVYAVPFFLLNLDAWKTFLEWYIAQPLS